MRAKAAAAKEGRYLPIVASVCGVDEDPQNREEQVEKLRQAGVIVLSTNAQAARLAAMIAGRTKRDELRDLLHDRLEVINIGLPEFANDLEKQGVSVIHVDWRPLRTAACVEVQDPAMRTILGKLL
jgi:FdrA protein